MCIANQVMGIQLLSTKKKILSSQFIRIMVAADLVRCLRLGKIRSAFIIDHRLILSVEESGGQMKI